MEHDKELKAINDIISALEGLDGDARLRVVNYVFERLGLKEGAPDRSGAIIPQGQPLLVSPSSVGTPSTLDIRNFREQRQPNSAIQMAVLVAYYLQEIAPEMEKKNAIGVEDVKKYFNQASFPLPKVPISALRNAKAAGYLELAERGLYKLNPVGHNLAAYGLPEKGTNNGTKKRSKKAKSKKKTTKK